jgi:hypothetical protein
MTTGPAARRSPLFPVETDRALGAMAERPKYRALGRLVLEMGGIEVKADSEFFHEGAATNGMLPLNAAARAARLKSIPGNWRDAPHPGQIRRIARSLGFNGGTTSEATAAIEAFIRETESQKETTP